MNQLFLGAGMYATLYGVLAGASGQHVWGFPIACGVGFLALATFREPRREKLPIRRRARMPW